MKKMLFPLFLVIFSSIGYSQSTLDLKFTTNGIAPIPAFTLNKPSGMILLKTKLIKNLEFDPIIGFSLPDGRLWFSDLWLRYNFPLLKKKLVTTVGFNYPSYFGKTAKIKGEPDEILRFLNLQSKTEYTFNKNNSIIFDYWYLVSVGTKDNVMGHYFSLLYDWQRVWQRWTLKSELSTFYLIYSKDTKGFASSVELILRHNQTGLFVGAQSFIPLALKTLEKAKFKKNISIGIKRHLF